MIGMKFGKLKVLSYAYSNKHYKPFFECVCECGNKAVRNGESMKRGLVRSCGCLSMKGGAHKRHGMTETKIYVIWQAMHARCKNPNLPAYANYGGRGIVVCERWNIFSNFLEDMGEPSKVESIERKDRSGNYCPENCKWATKTEQARNTSRNVFFEFNGETKCLAEWLEISGIKRSQYYGRLAMGYTPEKAIFTKIKRKNHK